MSTLFRCTLIIGVCVCAARCDGPSGGYRDVRTSPTAPTAPGVQVIRVASGIDQTPVTGATVVINDDLYYTDGAGQVILDGYWAAPEGTPIDIDAQGFLPRRTRVPGDFLVTLWPVASDAEAEAVREMVYRRGGSSDQVLSPPDANSPFYLTFLDDVVNSDVLEAWIVGTAAFGSPFRLLFEVTHQFQYEQNEIAVLFNRTAGCSPIAAWGFCRDSAFYKTFRVLPEKARDPETIRRVAASWFLGPNPLPGFMNPEAPASELSPLEIQTIRMILLRRLPNRWPDTDR